MNTLSSDLTKYLQCTITLLIVLISSKLTLKNGLVIQGDMKVEVKFVLAQMFTTTTDNTEELVYSNLFYPIIFMATAGSISTRLALADVYSVVRVAFSSSIWRWYRRWVGAVEEGTMVTLLLQMNFRYCYLVKICLYQPAFISTSTTTARYSEGNLDGGGRNQNKNGMIY